MPQESLWAFGGCPDVARSDNLSAATHELRSAKGRTLTARYRGLLGHYGMRSTRIRPGEAHENGVGEQRHCRTKSALAQALVIRGRKEFVSLEAYEALVRRVLCAPARLRWRRSPDHTGTTYPSRWRLAVPSEGLDLAVEPWLEAQEMRTSFVYWEGAVRVTGTASGNGYVELTGYARSLQGVF